MAIGRGRFSERILEKAPRTGRKKVSKKKTPKVAARPRVIEDIQIEIPEIINIPGIGEIELPKQKRKTKAKKADAKPDIGRQKKVKAGKKRPPKVRITEAKPKVREDIQIDIPEIINIPGIGQIEVPKAKPKPKPKAKPKPKPKAKDKVKARPKPKPRPVKLPDELIDENLREDIRITPGMLEGLIGGEKISAPTAPKPPVETSEGPVPRPGKIVSGPVLTTPDETVSDRIFGRLPDQSNLSELDKLKQRFDMLTSMRFVKDPGPEHYQRIKELGDQIYALDKNFKSEYYTPDDQSAPTPPTTPTAPKDRFAGTLTQEQIRDLFERDLMDYDDDYFYDKDGIFGEKGLSYKKGVPEDVVDQIAADVNQAANQAKTEPPPIFYKPPVAAPPPSDVMPGEVFMDEPKYRPPGDPVSAPTPPPQPRVVSVDPFKGFKDAYRPANIVGQSFDPSVRDDYEKQMQAARAAMMQPGGNIRASEYPTYQTPTLAVPQTQFGGYGQPMPVAPLLPYAGLATATPPQEIPRPPASGARVNPGTGQIEPEGIAPPPRVTNLPPGVTGPIR